MATMEKIENHIELKKAGMRALVKEIGDANAQEFVRHCRGTPGWDFCEWLNTRPEKSPDEIEASIERGQARARAAGVPDCGIRG